MRIYTIKSIYCVNKVIKFILSEVCLHPENEEIKY